MSVDPLLEEVRRHPAFAQAGMILTHVGVVRRTSRAGRPVNGLRVQVDRGRLEEILTHQRARPGIVDIQVRINADRDLAVGDEVMVLLVAGDVRENVIAVLQDTLNAVKTEATRKTQYFGDA